MVLTSICIISILTSVYYVKLIDRGTASEKLTFSRWWTCILNYTLMDVHIRIWSACFLSREVPPAVERRGLWWKHQCRVWASRETQLSLDKNPAPVWKVWTHSTATQTRGPHTWNVLHNFIHKSTDNITYEKKQLRQLVEHCVNSEMVMRSISRELACW